MQPPQPHGVGHCHHPSSPTTNIGTAAWWRSVWLGENTEGGEACTALQIVTRQFSFLSIRPHYSCTWLVSEVRTASLTFLGLHLRLCLALWLWPTDGQHLHHLWSSATQPATEDSSTGPVLGLFAHCVKRCWGHCVIKSWMAYWTGLGRRGEVGLPGRGEGVIGRNLGVPEMPARPEWIGYTMGEW